MPLRYEDLERTHPPGRRVRFLPTEAVRKKIPPGIAEGVIREIVPRPALEESVIDRDVPVPNQFGLIVEIVRPDGTTDAFVLDVDDVELVPHDVP